MRATKQYLNRYTCDQTPSAKKEDVGICFGFYSTLLVHEESVEECRQTVSMKATTGSTRPA